MKAQYAFRCPVGECKGLVETATWKCALCDAALCRRCHVVKEQDEPGTKETKHACKEDDVESAKATMRDTEALPEVRGAHLQVSGCATRCTARPVTRRSAGRAGRSSAVRYRQSRTTRLQRKLGATAARVVGGVPGWLDLQDVCVRVGRKGEYLHADLRDVHRLVAEVNDALVANGRREQLREKDSLDVRVAYLAGELDEKGLKRVSSSASATTTRFGRSGTCLRRSARRWSSA